MTSEDISSTRPARFPADYGSPSEDGLLPWSFVEERLLSAPNYWLATVTASGHPHVRPVDGVWVDGALCFGGSDETRWVRNLSVKPHVSVNLPNHDVAIVLEGTVARIGDASHPLAAASTAASRLKYPQYFTDTTPPFEPFWALRPRVVFAWTLEGFPARATRWTFDRR